MRMERRPHLGAVSAEAILGRVNRHSGHTKLMGGTDDTNGDFLSEGESDESQRLTDGGRGEITLIEAKNNLHHGWR